jgi:amino acid transporter
MPPPDVSPLARRLGLTSAAGLVVANAIGAGVFTTSGFALASLGQRDRVLWAWLLGGALALAGALSYGAIVRRFPESGGEYALLTRTAHPSAGFLAGWISLLAGFSAPIAAAALGLEAYVGGWFGIPAGGIGSGAILLAAALHGVRFEPGIVLQNLAVGVKLLAIAAFVAFGLARGAAPGAFAPVSPGSAAFDAGAFDAGAFAVTLVWISFAYSGWNAAIYIAGEVRDPGRNLMRALGAGTAVIIVAYTGLNVVFLWAAPVETLAGRADVAAVAALALGGPDLAAAVAILIALALWTSLSSMVLAGSRVIARMAADGVLPGALARGERAPSAAVALQTAVALGVFWLADLATLLGYIGFTLGLCAAATVASGMALRHREGPEGLPMPGYPWLPGAFVLATVTASGFLVFREPLEAVAGGLTLASGFGLWTWVRRRTRSPGARDLLASQQAAHGDTRIDHEQHG